MGDVLVDDKVTSILDEDAVSIKKIIEQKKMSVSEITAMYIQRIKETNPSVNFLTEDRFLTALQEAEEADRILATGEATGALFGVPISMKESFDVMGMQTTGGLQRLKGVVPDEDAEVVDRLKAEGAIILGKTNTPELCFCQETDNKLYGRTYNPWNLERTAGGSSGGEGAAIALGCAAVGLGSDIGGSIRFPSHFNGVIGFISGNGSVSQEGSFPYVDNDLQQRMLGIGPIAKSVRDAKLLYSIISDQSMTEQSIHSFTINVFRTTTYPLSAETNKLLNDVYLFLKDEFSTERESVPLLDKSALLWQQIMSIDGGKSTSSHAFGSSSRNAHIAYVKEMVKGNSDIHRYLSWALIGATLFKPSNRRIDDIRRELAEGDKLLEEYLDHRLLVMPVYHTAAPQHNVVYKEIFSIKKTFLQYMPYTAYANTWGLPALTIPVGTDKEGMPIGLQIIGKNGNEDAIFSLGTLLEKQFMGYQRAKMT